MRKELQGKSAILYRRVSTTDQKENGNSLNTQRHSLRTFANDSGMDIIREFQEDFSAKNFERPEFNRLLDFVKKNKNKVDYILDNQYGYVIHTMTIGTSQLATCVKYKEMR